MSETSSQTVNSVIKALKSFAFILAAYAAINGYQTWQTAQSTYETSGAVLKIDVGTSLTSLSLGYFDQAGTPQAATLVIKNSGTRYSYGQKLSFMANTRTPQFASRTPRTGIWTRTYIFGGFAVGVWLLATMLSASPNAPKRRARPAKGKYLHLLTHAKSTHKTQPAILRKTTSFSPSAPSVRRMR